MSLAMSYKWLGVDAGENGGKTKMGEAIRWLMLAKSTLEEVEEKMSSGINIVRVSKDEKKSTRGKLGQQMESVNAFLNAYKKVNDSVSPTSRHFY